MCIRHSTSIFGQSSYVIHLLLIAVLYPTATDIETPLSAATGSSTDGFKCLVISSGVMAAWRPRKTSIFNCAFIRRSFPWTELGLLYVGKERKWKAGIASTWKNWHSRQQSLGKISWFGGSGGITGDCLVQGQECSQTNAMVRSSWAWLPSVWRTGSAEVGAPHGRWIWPVGLGVVEEQVWSIPAVTQREVVLQTCFLPCRTKLFNPMHSSPPGDMPPSLRTGTLINQQYLCLHLDVIYGC